MSTIAILLIPPSLFADVTEESPMANNPRTFEVQAFPSLFGSIALFTEPATVSFQDVIINPAETPLLVQEAKENNSPNMSSFFMF